ncbi:T6SS effector amidase Tae4 family protein [Serratia marcescens]|uniref:T6SS effector amidase Tae4 family protein n=1 Tax=Serratia marcescens TaxID=615 RepID=UPI00201B58F8|nr:T6SS effector amidase Tae4 family protein [Serratia marcescens]
MTKIWGKPDLRVKFPPPGGGELAGKKGIILFEIAGWSDAGGHATLWNGKARFIQDVAHAYSAGVFPLSIRRNIHGYTPTDNLGNILS